MGTVEEVEAGETPGQSGGRAFRGGRMLFHCFWRRKGSVLFLWQEVEVFFASNCSFLYE